MHQIMCRNHPRLFCSFLLNIFSKSVVGAPIGVASMYDLGWKTDPSLKSPYYLEGDFSLTPLEQKALALLASHIRQRSQSVPDFKICAKSLEEALLAVCADMQFPMLRSRAELLKQIAEMNLKGLGIFDLLLSDPALEEIAVTGAHSPIRVYRRCEGWLDTNCFITSKEFALSCMNKIGRRLGRRITSSSPALDAMLPDGSRLHASWKPLNADDFEITIRKFTASPLSIPELAANRTISFGAAAFLWAAAFADISILICGNTGSGKTSLLNALFSFIPLDERILLVEESPEVRLPHPHKVRLVSNERAGLGMRELVQNSLRMRPDRVVVGEARSEGEVAALFECLQSGQAKGSFATFHGRDSRQALARLRHFGIPAGDLSAIDLIVVMRRISIYDPGKGKRLELRRVMEITEITPAGNPRILFAYDLNSDSLVPSLPELRKCSLLNKMSLNYRMGVEGLLHEIKRREGLLKALPIRTHGFGEFTQFANSKP